MHTTGHRGRGWTWLTCNQNCATQTKSLSKYQNQMDMWKHNSLTCAMERIATGTTEVFSGYSALACRDDHVQALGNTENCNLPIWNVNLCVVMPLRQSTPYPRADTGQLQEARQIIHPLGFIFFTDGIRLGATLPGVMERCTGGDSEVSTQEMAPLLIANACNIREQGSAQYVPCTHSVIPQLPFRAGSTLRCDLAQVQKAIFVANIMDNQLA